MSIKAIKGQTSLETIVILSLFLGILIVILLSNTSFLSISNAKHHAEQTTIALDTLTQRMQYVYHQGVGAQQTVTLRLPPNFINATLQDKTVVFRMAVRGGNQQEVFRNMPFNVSGQLPNRAGSYVVVVRAVEYGVNVTYVQ
ncbi:MAG: hypothetical protein ACMXYC_02700 [Candidatus Woesearchaeota archaeon]